jgi:glycosyltransferase involved in cell wall biosynthesis
VSAAVRPLRVGVDATPLLGRRTGIGLYVQHLLQALSERSHAGRDDLELSAAGFSVRRRHGLRSMPAEVRVIHRPVPARLLHRAWRHGDWPPAEWVLGRQDVVHGTNYVLPPARRAAGVVSVHDLSFLHYPNLVAAASLDYRELVPHALSRAAVVLVLSQAMAAEVTEAYRVPADRLRVVPLGVDAEWLSASSLPPVRGFPSEYLIALGTLEPRKGLDVLLRAYRELTAEQPATPPLVLVGSAGWGPELDVSGVARERVLLPGYCDARTVRGLVANAAALVYPSRYEGFGLPPLEALAAGTPVIASDLPAIREVVGGHARLIPAGDAAALAAAIRDVLDRPPAAEWLAAGRGHAAEFSWTRCAELTAASYHAAAG